MYSYATAIVIVTPLVVNLILFSSHLCLLRQSFVENVVAFDTKYMGGLSICKGVKLAHMPKLDVQNSALKSGSGIWLYELPRWTTSRCLFVGVVMVCSEG